MGLGKEQFGAYCAGLINILRMRRIVIYKSIEPACSS